MYELWRWRTGAVFIPSCSPLKLHDPQLQGVKKVLFRDGSPQIHFYFVWESFRIIPWKIPISEKSFFGTPVQNICIDIITLKHNSGRHISLYTEINGKQQTTWQGVKSNRVRISIFIYKQKIRSFWKQVFLVHEELNFLRPSRTNPHAC